MVRVYQHSYSYNHSWEAVTIANWTRYPSPLASHIRSVDMLECSVDEQGVLRTKRLIVKTGVLPKWTPKKLLNSDSAYIIEETMVDPHSKIMTTRTVNLNHTKIMQVEELQTIKETYKDKTDIVSESRILSRFGFGLTNKIESFGESTVVSHTLKARQGLLDILKGMTASQIK